MMLLICKLAFLALGSANENRDSVEIDFQVRINVFGNPRNCL